MIFRAGPALGALLIGSLRERVGLRLPLAIGGVLSAASCAFTWARQRRMAPLLESEPPAHAPAAAAEKRAPWAAICCASVSATARRRWRTTSGGPGVVA